MSIAQHQQVYGQIPLWQLFFNVTVAGSFFISNSRQIPGALIVQRAEKIARALISVYSLANYPDRCLERML